MAEDLKFNDPVDQKLEEFLEKNKPQDKGTPEKKEVGKEVVDEGKEAETAGKKEEKVPEKKKEPVIKKEEIRSPEKEKETQVAYLTDFNKRFETSFESEDTLKSSLKRLAELKDLDDLRVTSKQLTEKLAVAEKEKEQLKNSLNPKDFFVNEDEYKRQMVLKKFGSDVNPDVLGKIITTDFKKASDLEMLILGKWFETPSIEGGYEGAKELVYDGLNIDDDNPEEWSTLLKNKIHNAATSVRKNLSQIKDVDIPDWGAKEKEKQQNDQQLAAVQEQSRQSWTGLINQELAGMNKFDVYDQNDKGEKEVIFTYDVGDDFKKSVVQQVVDFMVGQGLEANSDNLEEAIDYVSEHFIAENLPGMIRAAIKDTETRVSEKLKAEYDNPVKPRKDTTTESKADEEKKKMIQWLREGTGGPETGGHIFGKK